MLTQLISIRTDVARRYFAWETPANNDPSLQQLREYDMPGTAVQECHQIFRSKLEDVLRKVHDRNVNRKKDFDGRAAYKVFCDTWFGKKSIVDIIFRCGHWDESVADRWSDDRKQHPSGIAGSRAATTNQATQKAKNARREAHYELQKYNGYSCLMKAHGPCGRCGTDTATTNQHRVQCWVCQVEDHIVCTWCRQDCVWRQEACAGADSWHYPGRGKLEIHDQTSACESCGLGPTRLPDGGHHNKPDGSAFLACKECSRWLCYRCRFDQSVGFCITCPALQLRTNGHWGVCLRAPSTCKPWEEIASLLEKADRLSEAACTPCKKAGQQHYHIIPAPESRSVRISRDLKHQDKEY